MCVLPSHFLSPPSLLQELKQDISSFRYEVLDLLGNRKPERRTYSSSSEEGGGARPDEVGGAKARGASFSQSVDQKGRTDSAFSVSTLFSSMAREKGAEEGAGEKPRSVSPLWWGRLGGGTGLQRFSRSKRDSIRRLGLLFSRMNGHIPAPPRPATQPSMTLQQDAYIISDGTLGQPCPTQACCPPQTCSQIPEDFNRQTSHSQHPQPQTKPPHSPTPVLQIPHPQPSSSLQLPASSLDGTEAGCDDPGSEGGVEQDESITTKL